MQVIEEKKNTKTAHTKNPANTSLSSRHALPLPPVPSHPAAHLQRVRGAEASLDAGAVGQFDGDAYAVGPVQRRLVRDLRGQLDLQSRRLLPGAHAAQSGWSAQVEFPIRSLR